MSLSNFSIFIVKFRISMVKLVRINVSFVPKIKKIFSTLTPSSGQTKSSIGSSHISLESVLHKLSFDIKISRLPVDPKKTNFFFLHFKLLKYCFNGFLITSENGSQLFSSPTNIWICFNGFFITSKIYRCFRIVWLPSTTGIKGHVIGSSGVSMNSARRDGYNDI